MKIQFMGDPHIGRMSRVIGENGLKMQVRLWKDQVDLARENDVSHMVVLGDVFDNPFPTQHELSAVLKLLSDAKDMHWVIFSGNHDVHDASNNSLKLLSKLPSAGALTNVRFVLKTEELKWAGIKMLVVPWSDKVPETHNAELILFHNNVVGAKNDNKTLIKRGEGLNAGIFGETLTVGGHLHIAQRLGQLWFTGTPAQLNFGEPEEKHTFILTHDRNGLSMSSKVFEPPWILRNVKFRADDPPKCNEYGVYYKLNLSEERPGPRWLIDHPQVIKVDGGKKKDLKNTVSKVINLLEGGRLHGEDDRQLLQRYMKEFSNLDQLSRARALKIDAKL